MSFADGQSRVNAAIARHLANVSAVVDGVAVGGVFSTPQKDIYGGLVSENRYTLDIISLAGVVNGSTVVIGAINYKVIGHSDLSGMTTLELELG